MWTASIISRTPINGGLAYTLLVLFTDGTNSNSIPFNISDPNSEKKIIANQLNVYNAVSSFLPDAPTGAVDLTPVVPPPPVIDLAVQAKQTFAANIILLRQMNNAITLGLKTNADNDYVALKAQIQKNFIPDYLDTLSGAF